VNRGTHISVINIEGDAETSLVTRYNYWTYLGTVENEYMERVILKNGYYYLSDEKP
jgi:hypothetical protein